MGKDMEKEDGLIRLKIAAFAQEEKVTFEVNLVNYANATGALRVSGGARRLDSTLDLKALVPGKHLIECAVVHGAA